MTVRRPGPAATPPEVAKLRGLPRKQAVDPESIGDRAPKPDAIPEPLYPLLADGREAWDLYWQHGRLWLAYTDIPLVSRLCQLIDRYARITRAIEAEGLLIVNSRTKRSAVHNAVHALAAIEKRIAELEDLAHFNPSSRSRARVQTPAGTGGGDELSEWLARRRQAAG